MRPLIGVVLALAVVGVVAVAGSATTLVVTAARLTASRENAAQCQGAPTSTVNDGGGSEVTTVVISAIDGAACAGKTLKVILTNASGIAISSEQSAVISSADSARTFDYQSEHIPRADVASVATVFEH